VLDFGDGDVTLVFCATVDVVVWVAACEWLMPLMVVPSMVWLPVPVVGVETDPVELDVPVELVVATAVVVVDAPLPLVPPVILNPGEYWKCESSASSVMLMPYAAAEPRLASTVQSNFSAELS